MKRRDYEWEMAGSLTPELEGTPHSARHAKREKNGSQGQTEQLPADQPASLPGEKTPRRGAERHSS